MSSFVLGDVRDYTSMHAYLMTTAGSTARVEESSMSIVNSTGAGGGSLQDPECGRSMRSHCGRSPWNFQFNPTNLADIIMKKLHHQSSAYITMEWRGQQHAREAVESTASSATSTMQAMSSTPQPGSDKEGYGRA